MANKPNEEMIMTALVVNASSIGEVKATFLDAFRGTHRVYKRVKLKLTCTRVELFDILSRAMDTAFPIKYDGVYSSCSGGVEVSTLGSDGALTVRIEFMTEGDVPRGFLLDVQNFVYVDVREDGVYDIDIKHYYLDKDNDMCQIEHSMDTEDFKHLTTSMYPGIDLVEMMKLYSDSNESNIVLTGEPGTGKTCFAKMMMSAHALRREEDIDVIYVKDRELLKKDEFWARMSGIRPLMMILDDLDDELRPRTEGRNDIVNNLLSYSDGIFEVDTKIIITTNLTDNSIDKALIRPGRCFDILSLPQLTGDEAASIWTKDFNAPLVDFYERFGDNLTKISQAAIMSEHFRFLKSASPTYLKNPAISIRKIVEEA